MPKTLKLCSTRVRRDQERDNMSSLLERMQHMRYLREVFAFFGTHFKQDNRKRRERILCASRSELREAIFLNYKSHYPLTMLAGSSGSYSPKGRGAFSKLQLRQVYLSPCMAATSLLCPGDMNILLKLNISKACIEIVASDMEVVFSDTSAC